MISIQIRPDRQTLYWSATWPKEVEQLARQFLYNPYKVKYPILTCCKIKCINLQSFCLSISFYHLELIILLKGVGSGCSYA